MVNELLKELLVTIKDGKEFLTNQLPDVAVQILRFNFWHAVFIMFLGICFFVATFALLKYSRKNWKVWMDDVDALAPICSVGIGGFALVGFLFFLLSLIDILKITLAPKLYLIEYLKGMMN